MVRASLSVAMAALEKYNRGESVTPAALMPRYLRLSQAERERNAKKEKEGISACATRRDGKDYSLSGE